MQKNDFLKKTWSKFLVKIGFAKTVKTHEKCAISKNPHTYFEIKSRQETEGAAQTQSTIVFALKLQWEICLMNFFRCQTRSRLVLL